MAFPFIPLILAGASTWVASSWLNRSALESHDYVPRFGGGGTDARGWLVAIGLGGLLLGGAWPLLGSIAFGGGVAALVNYDTMDRVKNAVSQFMSTQPGGGMLEDKGLLDEVSALLETVRAPVAE